MRPEALLKLLKSVAVQSIYPDEILIIDGSLDNLSEQILEENKFKNLFYYKIGDHQRGLTKQRNFGIDRVASTTDIVCFLDDDTTIEKNYFYNLVNVFFKNVGITGVGGIATNDNNWNKNTLDYYPSKQYLSIDGYHIKLGQRHILRNYLGLGSGKLPGIMPTFSNGISCGYPITGKFYEVDLLIGMSMAFRKSILDQIKFSTYFEGYGLYEDADFSLRALAYGKNVLATNVLLEHHHDALGRPNLFNYGKMVTRNGWYVWRVKYSKPKMIARVKWNAIAIVLMMIRFVNVITTQQKKESLTEALGRFYGLISLIFNRPKVER
jgi:glycosyltransferase involved in cell wall biosynthesis